MLTQAAHRDTCHTIGPWPINASATLLDLFCDNGKAEGVAEAEGAHRIIQTCDVCLCRNTALASLCQPWVVHRTTNVGNACVMNQLFHASLLLH